MLKLEYILVTHISLSQIWTPCSNLELCLPGQQSEWEVETWRTKCFHLSLRSFPNLTVLQQVMDPGNWWLNSYLFSFLFWEPFNYYFAGFSTKGRWAPLIHNLFFGKARQERKHCQRHNGPEGWVHITKSHFTNLEHITISESRLSINFKISTKQQHLDKT